MYIVILMMCMYVRKWNYGHAIIRMLVGVSKSLFATAHSFGANGECTKVTHGMNVKGMHSAL